MNRYKLRANYDIENIDSHKVNGTVVVDVPMLSNGKLNYGVKGVFRRPGGEFLSGCPERNQRSTRARLRMSAPRSYSPPLDPILRGPQLSGLGSRRKGAGGSADQFPFYYRCR